MSRTILMRVVVVCLLVPFVAVADDLSDLKARSDEVTRIATSLDAKDLDAYAALFHAEALGFGRIDPTVTDMAEFTKEQLVAVRKQQIEQTEMSESQWIDPVYRVVGNTGYVVGLMRSTTKLKDGPVKTRFTRLSVTYTKSGGKWLITSWHFSDMPTDEP